ncbi:hypothetical protein DCC85_01855 [Paenibacillus sp. CAA11]|uniref:ATP-binding cassette domain-containing protein n=1 Tax=Paenibacillus sp. CAA11 TaxID=1532905 RepID=UPI000D382DB5|nr:ABC transporter ATP-binding protein [Paenibacillus sp. CAA11]AWB43099.1 hypothetical protein DCC85_01855 [Paenibacillus sp. CAA11]
MTLHRVFYCYFMKHKCRVGFLFIVTLISTLAGTLVLPLLTGKFIDTLTTTPIYKSVFKILALIIFFNIFNMIIGFVSNIFYAVTNTKIALDVILDTTKHIQSSSVEYSGNLDSAFTTEQINRDSNSIVSFLLEFLMNGSTKVITFIATAVLLFKINVVIFLIFLISLPIYVFIYITFKDKIYTVSLEFKNQQSAFFSEMNRQLMNIDSIKLNSWASILHMDAQSATSSFFKSFLKNIKVINLFSTTNSFMIMLTNLICLFIGGIGVIEGKITLGQLTMITSYFNITVGSLQYFLNFIQSYQEINVSLLRMTQHWQVEEETFKDTTVNYIQQISIKELSFSYNQNQKLIHSFSYTFDQGFLYSIIGRNGTGKSSLIKILAGLYTGHNNCIYYNGIPLTDLNVDLLRKLKLAIVVQDPLIMENSLFKNVTYGLDMKKVDTEKYSTYVTMFGLEQAANKNSSDKLSLSGGERQKSAIIRALLKEPDVLIMDEPTSMLDDHSVQVLLHTLRELRSKMIIIIVTHDSRIINESDRVINLSPVEMLIES